MIKRKAKRVAPKPEPLKKMQITQQGFGCEMPPELGLVEIYFDQNEEVCKNANDKIKILMPNNHIRISSIDQSLKLSEKEGGSVGETLTIGYAFLSSLLSSQNHLLPSVVDSPSGPVDLKIRKEIAKLIPKLGNQYRIYHLQ